MTWNLQAVAQTDAPEPFNSTLWDTKVLRWDGLIVGLLVRAVSNTEATGDDEIWAAFVFDQPWRSESCDAPPRHAFLCAYKGPTSVEDAHRALKEATRQ